MTLAEIFYDVHGKRQAELLEALGPEETPEKVKAEALLALRQKSQADTPRTLADYTQELVPYYAQAEDYVDELLETLATTDYLSRSVIANLLGNSTNPAAREALYRLADTDPSPLVRQHAVAALGKHATPADRAHLRQVLGTPPPAPGPPPTSFHLLVLNGGPMDVRSGAAEALGNAKDRESVPVLLSLIHDPSLLCQCDAIRALGTIGDPQALVPLEALYATLENPTDRRTETLYNTLTRVLKQLRQKDLA